jgi:hypothetical protein
MWDWELYSCLNAAIGSTRNGRRAGAQHPEGEVVHFALSRNDAAIAALEGNPDRAARLFGAGESLREAVGASVLPAYRADYESGMAAVRRTLSSESLRLAWTAGRAMPMDDAIRLALEGSDSRPALVRLNPGFT